MPTAKPLSVEFRGELRALLLERYADVDGNLIDRETDLLAGKVGGSCRRRRITAMGITMQTARALHLMRTGEWPPIIDHESRNPLDDSADNVRGVDAAESSRNVGPAKRTGVTGITITHDGWYRAEITREAGIRRCWAREMWAEIVPLYLERRIELGLPIADDLLAAHAALQLPLAA